ncbi:hypothetical protein L8P05_18975 [Enterobacter cloacae]|uniref:hypothetical protein n=1 Tax=Enterobacter cloacae TaxID=550 RepID=UPI002004464F|nr:hypothetical protein [Enterobacter cloacae]MCK7176007.1 hypothetical protein [Enterobacter cloacae]
MKRSDADVINQKSYSCAETRNAVSHAQAAESLHEISVKTPTLRDYFAAKAIGVIELPTDYVGTKETEESYRRWAQKAYLMADAMLKARE